MTGSGVVFAKDGMVNDGCGHLYFVLCTLCFVFGLWIQNTKYQVLSTKNNRAYYKRSRLKSQERTISKRVGAFIKPSPPLFPSIYGLKTLGNKLCQSEG